MSVNVDVGPIDFLALEVPGARLTGEGERARPHRLARERQSDARA